MARLVSPALLGAQGDVAHARERHRVRRLRRLALLLAVPLAYLVWHDATGHTLFHLPHVPTSMVFPLALIGLLAVVMLGPLLGAGLSPHTLYRPNEIETGLDDVVGIDAIKAEVVRSLNLFLGHKLFRDQMGGMPRRGILFEGPPGTGKTFVAKAMAKEADVPFLFVSASAFQSMFYGQTNRKIRAYFRALRRYARAEGGAIGFIEELDAIGGARRGMGTMRGEGVSGVVNELLVQLQSFDEPTRWQRVKTIAIREPLNRFLPPRMRIDRQPPQRANVLVIAATNRAADLDPALVRPGRFDRSLHFALPGRKARAQIVAYYLAKKSHEQGMDVNAASTEVAGMTFGYSPAALERLLDEALVVALTHGRVALTMGDIAEAKLATELGLKDEATYTSAERRRIATHEAGHATVAYFLGVGRKLDVLSIAKRRDSLGLLQHSDVEERFTQTRAEAEVLLRIAMGGLAAEELFFEDPSSGPAGDLQSATSLAAQMVGAYGMGESLVSMAQDPSGLLGEGLVARVLKDTKMRQEVEGLLEQAHLDAKELLATHRGVVETLATTLVERDELVGPEILDVIESGIRKASYPDATAMHAVAGER